MMRFLSIFIAATAMSLISTAVEAVTYEVPANGDRVVGEITTTKVPAGNVSLEQIAAEYQIGFSNMLEANPGVDPYSPHQGTEIVIPRKLILPDTVHDGIVVNSAEMRLYYYHDGVVDVLPIGIGQLGKDTPVGWVTKVERKKDGPTWTPSAKVRAEYAANGEPLPAVVPSGKENPMGLYALYVGRLFAIHGTNANFGIGLRVSHGCVRLRDPDIKYLFYHVPVGTRVEFINEPVKIAKESNGGIYVEVHQPLSTSEEQINSSKYSPIILKGGIVDFINRNINEIDKPLLQEQFNNRSGYPVLLNPVEF